jgi:NitT/TauT family transport system substrate-binding protein
LPLDASFSYMFVAEEKGYFLDEGIDITFLPASGSVANAGLIGGSIQYSAAVSTAENAIMRGAPLKVIFVTQRRSTHRLWSFDPAVTQLSELRGKLVAVNCGSLATSFRCA